MFSEILKIIPRLSTPDLNKMDRTLSQRFGKIASKFGKGLTKAIAGGGLAGLALGLVERLLNPLKEVQATIDKIMGEGDDLVTNAEMYGTDPGKLKRLTLLGNATGLEDGEMFELLNKFQSAVAEAVADPKKESSVRNFVDIPDTVDAFYEWMQAVQKLPDMNARILAQNNVFGERKRGKAADFMQTDQELLQFKLRGLPSSYELGKAANRTGAANDYAAELGAVRGGQNFVKTSKLINSQMVEARDAQLRLEEERERTRIAKYDELMVVANMSAAALSRIEAEALRGLAVIVPKIKSIADIVERIPGSRFFRGLIGE
jgi:hypothetical protein